MSILELEKDLESKGYWCGKSFYNNDDAKAEAKQKRSMGCKARVVKYTTSVRGYYNYVVWYTMR